MSLEKYNYDNKETVLNAVSTQDFDNPKYFRFYEAETLAISNKETYAEFLAIIPWGKMSNISKIILASLQKIKPNLYDQTSPDRFYSDVTNNVESWCSDINFKLNRINNIHTLRNDLKNSRSLISSVQGINNLKSICNTIISCNNSGVLPQNNDNQLFLQFPGSFNPFPHSGHIEISSIAKKNIANNESLIVITTFEKNKHRTDTSQPIFSSKIDLLHRGFAFESKVVIIGIKGDTEHQFRQMKLIASLSNNNSVHYICGDDAFIKKVNQAKAGYGKMFELFNSKTTFYISRRKGSSNNLFNECCLYAKEIGTNVILLPDQKLNLSGTKIREKTNNEKLDEYDYPNKYVEEYMNGMSYLSKE